MRKQSLRKRREQIRPAFPEPGGATLSGPGNLAIWSSHRGQAWRPSPIYNEAIPTTTYIPLTVTVGWGDILTERETPRRMLWARRGQGPRLYSGDVRRSWREKAVAPAGLGQPENECARTRGTWITFCSYRKSYTPVSR